MGSPKGPWVGGGAMRKHVPAERMNELKHVPAKLGESKLGSTATTRRVKQSIAMGANNFKTLAKNRLFGILGSKMGEKKAGVQAPGPPRRDPGRNSAPDPGFKVPNGGMATHLVAKRCDLGSLGVPGPASTPGPRALRLLMGFRHGGEWDLNVGSGAPSPRRWVRRKFGKLPKSTFLEFWVQNGF